MQCPRVTVLMTVYNGGRYLAEAIQSVLDQTFHDFEFLIIDNASTDDSRQIIQSFGDPRIRLEVNDVNLGPAAALNRGLKLARGQYVARMDADDIALPDRLSRQVRFLDEHSSISLIGTQVQMIDSVGQVLCQPILPVEQNEVMWKLMFTSPVMHSSVMARREVLEQLNGYDERFRYTPDYDLWSRVVARGCRIANLEDVLTFVRIHQDSDGPTAVQTQLIDDVATISQQNIERFLGLRLAKNDVKDMIQLVNYQQCALEDMERAFQTFETVARTCAACYGPEVLRFHGKALARLGVTLKTMPMLRRAALLAEGLFSQIWPLNGQTLAGMFRLYRLVGHAAGTVRLKRYRSSWKYDSRS